MIVVTTPTGNIGSKVLHSLLDANETLRVVTRDGSKLSERVRAKIEVVEGSLLDPEAVTRAYQGADQVFFLIPPSMTATNVDAYYREFAKVTIDAILSAKVKRVLYVSGTGLGYEKKAGAVSASFLVEKALEDSGAALRILHCGTFMENILHSVQSIRFNGDFSTSVPGDVKLPWVATQDIAAAAVKLLLDKSWSGTGSVGVLGPEDLSYDDLSGLISKCLGKTIQYRAVSSESIKAIVMQYGAAEASAQGLVDIYSAMANGVFNRLDRTSASSSPTKFSDWCAMILKPAILN